MRYINIVNIFIYIYSFFWIYIHNIIRIYMYTHLLRIVYMLRISMAPFVRGSQGMKMARLKELAPFFGEVKAPSVHTLLFSTGKKKQILRCPTDSWRHTRPQFFRI